MKMGSQGGGLEEPKQQSLARQGSFYSLTLDEVQNQVTGLSKPLGRMNFDELLKTVSTVHDNGCGGVAWSPSLCRQGSLTLSKDLSTKTVDEVWREIQEKKKNRNGDRQTLGETTLEDLLAEVGVAAESTPEGNSGECDSAVSNRQNCNQWLQFQPVSNQQNMMAVFVPGHCIQQPPLAVLDAAAYPGTQMSSVTLSDTQVLGRKRVAPGDDLEEEKTIERRQKRMIKNRESAARSRARKQAYTHELEIKVSRLEEENTRLRRQKELDKVLPVHPPEPKQRLRRTSSASF